jgi:hypothetical protein
VLLPKHGRFVKLTARIQTVAATVAKPSYPSPQSAFKKSDDGFSVPGLVLTLFTMDGFLNVAVKIVFASTVARSPKRALRIVSFARSAGKPFGYRWRRGVKAMSVGARSMSTRLL